MQTVENMAMAFVGESQARNRYAMYAKVAAKENLFQISEIFLLTAENEREHAKWFFRMMNDVAQRTGTKPPIKIGESEVPSVLGTTKENLMAAIEGEHHENSDLYPGFAKTAEEEGFKDIAVRVRSIAKAEIHHEQRYRDLLKIVEAGTVLKKDQSVPWVCSKCGYVHDGNTPPGKCPSCNHEAIYFQIKCETY
ncbi:rubrerythrin family protein [Candidatus Micrarchaeota archaeon]|nr:rubrerythrin family protein [Candidatus Micrarchaeota archaeon]